MFTINRKQGLHILADSTCQCSFTVTLLYCVTHVTRAAPGEKQRTKKANTGSQCCRLEVNIERTLNSGSNVPEEALQSVTSLCSSSYTCQHSMGSIDETNNAQPSYGGGTPHLQCDPGVPAELDLVSKGGSLVEFLCSGDLDLAAPSSSKLSQDYSPPCKFSHL